MNRLIAFALALSLWSIPAFGQDVILTQVSQDEAWESAGGGEAWVVTLPQDPNTVVVIWLAAAESENPGGLGDGPLGGYCGIGRSTDDGRTWSIRKAPFQNDTVPGTVPICGDPAGGVLPDGSIVFTAVELGSPTDFIQAITSRDGGQTWTGGGAPFGPRPALASALANQGVPDMGPGRQFLAVDPITGEVSIQSQVDVATTGRQLTVSTDRGRTWSTPRNTGSTSFGPIGAAHGVVAGIYPSGDDIIFQTTTDHGASWIRNPMPSSTGPMGRGITAADPTKKGRFAVLLGDGNALEVWITDDGGRTATNWTLAKVFTAESGASFSRPWIGFGPNGTLGVSWRYHYADGSFDVDGVVSRDGGVNWGNPVRMTAGRGPSPPQPSLTLDHCACNLNMTANRLMTTWADMTTGHLELWFGSFDYTTP